MNKKRMIIPSVSPNVVTIGATTSSGSTPFLNEKKADITLTIERMQIRKTPVPMKIIRYVINSIPFVAPVNVPIK